MRTLALAALSLFALAGAAHAQEMTATCKDGTAWSGARRATSMCFAVDVATW